MRFVFDTAGGVIVALWGTAYLTDVSDALCERLAEEQASEE